MSYRFFKPHTAKIPMHGSVNVSVVEHVLKTDLGPLTALFILMKILRVEKIMAENGCSRDGD